MNNNQLQILFISIAAIVTSAFIFILVRKNNKHIEMGELKDEDVIGVFETWDSKSNETIKTLHPKVRKNYSDFINDLSTQGIKYRLYSGLRTFEEQAELYGKGRTESDLILVNVDKKYARPTEKRVTDAIPGKSYHNYGLAGDGVEIVNGSAIWKSPNEQKIVETAKKYDLYWGGNFGDSPHFEYKLFGSVAQLLALYNNNQKDSNGYLIV